MLNYVGFKSSLNASPSAFTFGKYRSLGTSIGSVSEYMLIWNTTDTNYYRRTIHSVDRSASLEHTFQHGLSGAKYTFSEVLTKLQASPGHYYTFQFGGSSSSYVLVKAPSATDDTTLTVNVLRFQHTIGWTTNCSETDDRPLGVPARLRATCVSWMSSALLLTKLAAIATPPVHWVWFRKPGYRLTQEIIERAYSWIALNPDGSFHLWTDIPTYEDAEDFFANIEPAWKTQFLEATTIHYADETSALIEEALNHFSDSNTEAGISALRAEFMSPERQARVYKTDFARLFILWKHGGMYADFNDLLCLAPMKQLFTVYDPTAPLGVTDHADLNHATNYFLYSPPKHEAWEFMLRAMITDVPHLVRMIRDTMVEEAVLEATKKVLCSCTQSEITQFDTTHLSTVFNRNQLPYVGNESINAQLWERLPYIILGQIAPEHLKHAIGSRHDYLKKPARSGRRGPLASPVFQALSEDNLLVMHDRLESEFHAQFLFWWTDFNLRTLMHFTNLPIFCRMRKIPLTMIPYGYYMSYACGLSWVGHIGDGTSYGMDGRKDVRIRNIYESVGC